MKTLINKTIGEIVAENYRTAVVFEKYGIDFCCNGNRSISEACSGKDMNPEKLLREIDNMRQENRSESPDFQSWPLDLLADYIEKKHHRYVEEKIQILKQYLEKIGQVHGDKHPELFEIAKLFNTSAGELTVHMKKEEFILFPYVRKMVKAKQNKEHAGHPHFGTVENPVQTMMHEHDIEGERFRKICELSNNYHPPKDACNTYQVTYATLKEFEVDLHLHIHLENNILFPKAIAMEKELSHE